MRPPQTVLWGTRTHASKRRGKVKYGILPATDFIIKAAALPTEWTPGYVTAYYCMDNYAATYTRPSVEDLRVMPGSNVLLCAGWSDARIALPI